MSTAFCRDPGIRSGALHGSYAHPETVGVMTMQIHEADVSG